MRSSSLLARLKKSLLRNTPAKIVCLAAAVVVFFFVRTTSLQERFFTVSLDSRVSSRFMVTAGLPSTATVTLRGEGDSIFQISPDDIAVYVDLTETKNEGVFRVPIRIEKRGEAAVVDPLEVTVDPAEVTATVEQVVTRTLHVLPVIGSPPPEGYTLAEYAVEPTTVQVTGPRRMLQALQAITTAPVDLSEVRESSVLSVKLDYDTKLLKVARGNQVQLDVTIEGPGAAGARGIPETVPPLQSEPEQAPEVDG